MQLLKVYVSSPRNLQFADIEWKEYYNSQSICYFYHMFFWLSASGWSKSTCWTYSTHQPNYLQYRRDLILDYKRVNISARIKPE